MAARLPRPGKDHGKWGELLNDYLSVAHDDAGNLKSDSVATSHIQDNAITADKLDPSLQAVLAPTSAMAAQPQVLAASVATGTVQAFYRPEDYGCAVYVDPSINDAAIAAAIQDAISHNGIVQFTGAGPYNVSQAINQDVSLVTIRGNKTTLDVNDSFTGSYFWSLFSSAPYQYATNQGAALSGIILTGAGLGTPQIATAAIQIGHSTYQNNCLLRVEDVYIQGFTTGFQFIANAWRVKIANSRVTGGQALVAAPNLVNFGENMVFENCIFESYFPTITIGTGEWNFVNCSFNTTLVTLNGNCIVKLIDCHIEPHTVYPCVNLAHSQATMIMNNPVLIIDPTVVINSAVFNVVNSNTTYGLLIRNLSTIQSANYLPQVSNQNCVLVSGGGRVDLQGFSSNVNSYGFVVAKSCNLIYNGDGEKGSTAGWTTYATYGGPASFAADTSQTKYGTYSLKLSTNASSIYVGQAVPCRPGQWLLAQCWNKLNIDSGTANTSISVDFLSAKGDVILTTGYTNLTTTTYWTCRRNLGGMTPVAPAGTVSARVYISLVSSVTASAWYDDIIVNVV